MHTRSPDDPLRGPIQESSERASEIRDAMASVSVAHDVEPLRGDLAGVVSGISIGEVHVAFVKYGAPTRVIADPTQHAVCWALPLGPMDVRLGTATAHTMRNGFVLGRDTTTEMIPDPDRGALVITTTAERLARHFHATTGYELPAEVAFSPRHSARNFALLDASWRYVARLLESSAEPLPGLLASAEQTVLTAMIIDLPEVPLNSLIPPSRANPSLSHANRAVEWLQENLTEPVTISSWARAIGVSSRHLQQVIREVRGVTPTQLLLEARLERAHRVLRESGPERTVGGIAAEAGFSHAGRFAAAYRARYGVSPSETLHA